MRVSPVLDHEEAQVSVGDKVGVLTVVFGLPILVGVALVSLSDRGLTGLDLSLLLGFYLATGFGITGGFHRLFTHKSFETYLPIKIIWAVLGSMAIQGSLFTWVGWHGKHHTHSDQVGDPHSPHRFGKKTRDLLRGYFYAHVLWLLNTSRPDGKHYIGHLKRLPALVWVDRLFLLWVVLSFALPGVIAGLVTRSWTGAWWGFVWGGPVRIFLLHHVTWSINSVCHMSGHRAFDTPDKSRNNWFFGLCGLGEGWHNNHHQFPTSARHGLERHQVDATWVVIWLLSKLKLVWAIRLPKQATASNECHL